MSRSFGSGSSILAKSEIFLFDWYIDACTGTLVSQRGAMEVWGRLSQKGPDQWCGRVGALYNMAVVSEIQERCRTVREFRVRLTIQKRR